MTAARERAGRRPTATATGTTTMDRRADRRLHMTQDDAAHAAKDTPVVVVLLANDSDIEDGGCRWCGIDEGPFVGETGRVAAPQRPR